MICNHLQSIVRKRSVERKQPNLTYFGLAKRSKTEDRDEEREDFDGTNCEKTSEPSDTLGFLALQAT